MDEYIEREAAYREICSDETMSGYEKAYCSELIRNIPAADVAPVRHGKWDFNVGMNFFRERNCPVCKKRIESNFWNYCPSCGAKMDGGVE